MLLTEWDWTRADTTKKSSVGKTTRTLYQMENKKGRRSRARFRTGKRKVQDLNSRPEEEEKQEAVSEKKAPPLHESHHARCSFPSVRGCPHKVEQGQESEKKRQGD